MIRAITQLRETLPTGKNLHAEDTAAAAEAVEAVAHA